LKEPGTPISRLLLYGYLVFLVYGSLYPLSSFRLPDENPLALLFEPRGPRALSRTDALANLLVYLPLGWLLRERGFSLARAGLLGCVFSFIIEWLQAYLPGRVPSFLDLALNTAGTVLGAALASRFHRVRWLQMGWRHDLPPRARLGLAAVLTWAASQLFPFIPSIDIGNLRAGMRPLWHVVSGRAPFSFTQAAVYALAAIALSRILMDCLPRNFRYRSYVPAAFLAVLAAKVPILGRQLSLEALLGVLGGLALSRWFLNWDSRCRVPLLAAAGAFVIEELRSGGPSARLQPFHWIPLRSSLQNELIGAADILATAWPFLAVAYLASARRHRAPRLTVLGGAAAVFGSVMALEWVQRFLPGRTPDITDALVAAGAWLLAWRLVNGNDCASGPRPDPEDRFPSPAAEPSPPPLGPR
jgi:VanZ family protein